VLTWSFVVILQSVDLEGVAGYRVIRWRGLRPGLNLLLGENGAGKSTVLQAITMGLTFLADGNHSEDVLAGAYPDAQITLRLTTTSEPVTYSFQEILKSPTKKRHASTFEILSFVENRQPQNRVGRRGNTAQHHPTARYPRALATLQHFLHSADKPDQDIARKTLEYAQSLQPELADWAWIENEVKRRGSKQARPVSCGQFDLLAVLLDVARLKQRQPVPLIVILDNPDIFLHPALHGPLLDLIRRELDDPQLLVATHSLKLLSHPDPKAVFWLNRAHAKNGAVEIQSVRNLDQGTRGVFVQLYGTDTTSAVLDLVRELESPAYFQFLRECALPPAAEKRPRPGDDPQLVLAKDILREDPATRTIIDFGAGHGDLLKALVDDSTTSRPLTYIAVEHTPSKFLAERFANAERDGALTTDSRIITTLDDAPPHSDIIFALNVCHELRPHDLAETLAAFIARLRTDKPSRVVLVEMEMLITGEAGYIMWTPEEYQDLFLGLPGVDVTVQHPPRNGVPIGATILTVAPQTAPVTASQLLDRLREMLGPKKQRSLDEIETLQAMPGSDANSLPVFLRARKLAFHVAQVAMISLEERRAGNPIT
jgi:AAA domain